MCDLALVQIPDVAAHSLTPENPPKLTEYLQHD